MAPTCRRRLPAISVGVEPGGAPEQRFELSAEKTLRAAVSEKPVEKCWSRLMRTFNIPREPLLREVDDLSAAMPEILIAARRHDKRCAVVVAVFAKSAAFLAGGGVSQF